MRVMWPRQPEPDRSVDADPSSGKPGNVDEQWSKQEMHHREILESELLMVRPMRFSGRVEVFEPSGRQPGDERPTEHLARADAITAPDVAALELGTLIAKAIAGRLENPRTLLLAVMTWGLLSLAIGFACDQQLRPHRAGFRRYGVRLRSARSGCRSVLIGVRSRALRRFGFQLSLHRLEGEHLIKARRAAITIKDRPALEALADGSYGIPEQEYRRVIGGGGLPNNSGLPIIQAA